MKKALITLIASTLITGCSVPARIALKGVGGRSSYNELLQITSNEQLLLNLVRLRYSDTPYFLTVNNVTTQFSFNSSLNATVPFPGINSENPLNVGGNVSWQSQPTVQYTPLEGRTFAEHLLQPIDLLIIQQSMYSGWDIDRVFRLTVQSMDNINNIPMAAGPLTGGQPQYEVFYQVTELMRALQLKGKLHIGAKSEHTDCINKGDQDEISIRGTTLQLLFNIDDPDSERLADLLPGIEKSGTNYVLDMKLGFEQAGDVGIMTRSVLSCMYYLSLGVDVPCSHKNMVNTVETPEGEEFDWSSVIGRLIHVYSSRGYPDNAFVAAKYRGYWYFIDNEDLNSKRTFALLQGLYNLQAGGIKQSTPLLTIPIGK